MFQTYINIEERMNYYGVVGLSVSLINRGQISQIENYGLLETETNKKVSDTSIFNACSISKFLTALLIMKLAEQGILDLDEDVNKKLISWKVPPNNLTDKKIITLRNLLSHQSGVIDPEDSFMELNPQLGTPSLSELLEGTSPYCKKPINIKYEPESDFHYSDAGFCIIQQLIEDVTGKPFKENVKELLFYPLKIENSLFLQDTSKEIDQHFSSGHNKKGKLIDGKYPIYPYPAASGLWTTTTDLSVLVLELMNALHNKSKIGISANIAKEMIRPQGRKSWCGLGVFLDGFEKEVEISSLGWGLGFQCLLVAYPHVGSGLIIMTNTDLGIHQLKGLIGEIYHSLKPLLLMALH